MSEAAEIEALDLAALLCSRVCHDIISPVGAINNGLEVLDEENNEEMKAFAFDLIRKSARQASAKLQFARLAFGAAGSAGAEIDLGDAEKVARGWMDGEKAEFSWSAPPALMAKNRVKLLLNMFVIAQQAIPRGGELTVDPVGEGDTMGFRIRAAGTNAREPQNIAEQLNLANAGSVSAHAVQPYYTALLADACGLKVSLAAEPDAVTVTAA